MSGSLPDWDLFQSLHAVLETGSLSAAARARGLTQPTLGRHVEALETRLGAPLFVRSPRGLQPTELAVELRPHLADMAAQAAAAMRDASVAAEGVSGPIRITASEMFGAEVLPPMLTGFRERHSGAVIELTLSNDTQDLLRREADIAVRMVAPSQSALVARKVGEVPLGFFATSDYVARYGAPDSLDAVFQHPVVGIDSDRRVRQVQSLQGMQVAITRESFAFRSDSDLAQLAAVRAGFGVGVVQAPLGARYGLVRLLPEFEILRLGVWIVMHENLRASRRIRLMFDHLVEGVSAYLKT
ncbi:LysR family transcriptional regulator [Phenylobacterium deserti]|uniref:LysR family transcriptional regulator n=1 Tax=Phenylobacterium deserti TaxID=1914756 RepID=A0A328AQG7_9CAUL|nr:LysR family transcriptional regulator [Phenylobacterium deserti]RAK57240.1 LysR family transcriptional regulator [Phenylobacterium deserti]